MIILISINARTLGKFLKRYKSRIKGKQEILKVAQKRSRTCSDLNGIARRVEFKELITNKTNQL